MALTKINANVIANNTIAVGNIADNSVDATKIASNSILTRHIDDNQVTTDQIAANTIATANIADNAVDGTKIASNSILTRHIDDDQVTGDQLADNIDIAGTFDVTGATTLDSTLTVAGDANFDSNTLFVDVSSNNVGIGTTSLSTSSGYYTLSINGSTGGQLSFQTGGSGKHFLYSTATDLNMYSAVDGALRFSTNNLERLEISSSATIFNDIGADVDFRVESDNLTHALFVQGSDGNVGIGTDSPADKLHVAIDSSTTNAEVEVVRIEATSSGTPAVGFGPFIDFRGDRINGGPDSYGRIGFEADAMPSTTVDGAFIVQTAEDGTYSERLRVTSDGDVGIGVTDPDGELHVESAGNADVYVERTSGAKIHLQAQSALGNIGTSSNHDLGFLTNASVRMRIDNTGRVGINRTPSKSNSKLEVGGADNVGLIHVEASGNFASWGIGSNQSKFYYNDTQMMGLTNIGEMKLMGGSTGGRQDIVFNNGQMSLANNASYTLSGVLNTGALISIGSNRSNVGVTYDHCIIFAETGTAATVVGNPSGRIALNSSSTDNKLNVYVSGGNLILVNYIQSTIGVSIAAFVFQGN